MKLGVKIGLGVAGVLAAIQLVPLDRSNPPVTAEVKAPDEVKKVLQRACFDCHSNQTVWPWYSHVAPVSFLVYRDVVEGRKHLNFSEWGAMPADRREKKQKKAGEEVKQGEMPLAVYLPMHPQALLSEADKKLLEDWASGPTSE